MREVFGGVAAYEDFFGVAEVACFRYEFVHVRVVDGVKFVVVGLAEFGSENF